MTQESFVDRIRREAEAEAEDVVTRFSELWARATQVAEVLRALGLPVPEALASVVGATWEPPTPPATRAPATVAPPVPSEESVPVEPSRPTPPEQLARGVQDQISRVRKAVEHRSGEFQSPIIAMTTGMKGSLVSSILDILVTDGLLERTEGGYVVKAPAEAPVEVATPTPTPTPKPAPPKPAAAKPAAAKPAPKTAGKMGRPRPEGKLLDKGRYQFEADIERVLRGMGKDITETSLAKELYITPSTAARVIRIFSDKGVLVVQEFPDGSGPITWAVAGVVEDAFARLPVPEGITWQELPVWKNAKFPGVSHMIPARQQAAIIALLQQKRLVKAEIAKELDLPDTRTGTYLAELREAGLIVSTGNRRRARFQDKGRYSEEYMARVAGKEGAPAVAPPPVPPPVPPEGPLPEAVGEGAAPASRASSAEVPVGREGVPGDQQLLNTLRRVMSRLEGEQFSAARMKQELDTALRTNLAPSRVTRLLEALVSSGSILAANSGVNRRYRYDRPTVPGAAASFDAQRRTTDAPAAGNGGGGAPVAGTGRGPKSPNKDVQDLLNAVVRIVGAENVSQSGGGHWAISCPNGERILISGTPSNPRSVFNDRARLRRKGGLTAL